MHTGSLEVNLLKESNAQVLITDMYGRVLYKEQMPASSKRYDIPLSEIYLIQVRTDTESLRQKKFVLR